MRATIVLSDVVPNEYEHLTTQEIVDQCCEDMAQSGLLDSEAGVFSCTVELFDDESISPCASMTFTNNK